MLTAVLFLGEHLTFPRIAGATTVLVGVALTRVGRAKSAVRSAHLAPRHPAPAPWHLLNWFCSEIPLLLDARRAVAC